MLLTIALVVMVALVIYRVRREKRTAKRDPESQVILEDSSGASSSISSSDQSSVVDKSPDIDGAGPTFRHTTKFQLAGPPKSLQLQDESAGDSFF